MPEKIHKIQQYKVDAVNNLKSMMEKTSNFIFTDFRGLNMGQMTDLRDKLREKEVSFRVVKNTFTKKAWQEMGYPEADENIFIDPTAIVLVNEEISAVTQILQNYTRESTLRIKGGYLEGKFFSLEELEKIARLPSREQLLSMTLSTMNGPLVNLLRVMNGIIQKMMRTIIALADKEKQEE